MRLKKGMTIKLKLEYNDKKPHLVGKTFMIMAIEQSRKTSLIERIILKDNGKEFWVNGYMFEEA